MVGLERLLQLADYAYLSLLCRSCYINRSAVGLRKSGKDLNNSRLSGAIMPDQAMDGMRLDIERYALECLDLAVMLLESADG